MKKRILGLVLAAVLCMGIVACSQPAKAPAAPATPATPATPAAPAAPAKPEVKKGQYVIKFPGQHAADYPSTVAIRDYFKPKIEAATNGAVAVQVFDNSQLGGERDIMEQLQLGSAQLGYISPVTAALDPTINVLDLPFLFRDSAHVDKVITGEIGEKILAPLLAKGLRGVGYFENGFRVLSNNKRAVNTVDDLKGLKIRVPEAPISIAIFKALEANPTPIAFNELYGALQQKVVDGQENGYNTFSTNKYYEVQKFIAETNHMWGSNALYVSEKFYQSVPADIQKSIMSLGKETCVYQCKIYRDMVSVSKKKAVDNGVTVTTPAREPFVAKTKVVYDDFIKQYPQYEALIKQIQAL